MLRSFLGGLAPRRVNRVWGRNWSATTGAAAEEGADTASSTASSAAEDRLHSTDIAFKPNQDGWGATRRYSKNHERIFGKKKKKKTEGEGKPGVTRLTFKTRQ